MKSQVLSRPATNGQARPMTHITQETVTPELAQKWLGRNYERQRAVSYRAAKQYAADMQAGRWKLTGDTIKLDIDGNVIDGQHRLLAVIDADVSIDMFVAWNVDTDAFLVLDQGRKRSFADYVRGLEVANSTTVAAAVSMVASFRSSRRFGSATAGSPVSISDLTETYEAEPGIADWAAVACAIGSKFKFSPATICAVLYVADVTGAAEPRVFANQTLTGTDLEERDPAYVLRELLITRSGLSADRRKSNMFYTAGIVRAWNAFARGDQLSVLRGSVEGKLVQFFDPHGMIDKRWPLPRKGA